MCGCEGAIREILSAPGVLVHKAWHFHDEAVTDVRRLCHNAWQLHDAIQALPEPGEESKFTREQRYLCKCMGTKYPILHHTERSPWRCSSRWLRPMGNAMTPDISRIGP